MSGGPAGGPRATAAPAAMRKPRRGSPSKKKRPGPSRRPMWLSPCAPPRGAGGANGVGGAAVRTAVVTGAIVAVMPRAGPLSVSPRGDLCVTGVADREGDGLRYPVVVVRGPLISVFSRWEKRQDLLSADAPAARALSQSPQRGRGLRCVPLRGRFGANPGRAIRNRPYGRGWIRVSSQTKCNTRLGC